MEIYRHRVQYYETDRMGITHHSNYVRWMEEARMDFLAQIGWPYDRMEETGVISPVTEVSCRYLATTTFFDEISIAVTVEACTGVRLKLRYDMTDAAGRPVCLARSEHCFLGKNGRPLRLQKELPALYETLAGLVSAETP